MIGAIVTGVVLLVAAAGAFSAVALVDRFTLPRSERTPPVRIQPGQGRHRTR